MADGVLVIISKQSRLSEPNDMVGHVFGQGDVEAHCVVFVAFNGA